MSTPNVQYRQLGKSGLRVSAPIVSRGGTPPVIIDSDDTSHIAGSHELWLVEMERAYTLFAVPCDRTHVVCAIIQPWILDEEPSLEIMKAAWDRGINTFDTANVYSNGGSERVIAKFIQKVIPMYSCRHLTSLFPSIKSPVTKS